MATFSSDKHTPLALAEEIEFITNAYPESLLVGSLGRAGVYCQEIGDANYEYKHRGQYPTQTFRGGTADLDIINAPLTLEQKLSPFDVDLRSFCGRQVTIVFSEGSWHLQSENRGFNVEIDERVMEPVKARTVYGARCRTLPARTHLALLGITGTVREQDKIASELLMETINTSRTTQPPNHLYQPFEDLFTLNYKSTMATSRRMYREIVPLGVRRLLAPTMQKVKDHHLR
jgi:hypothetical protein